MNAVDGKGRRIAPKGVRENIHSEMHDAPMMPLVSGFGKSTKHSLTTLSQYLL